jgi:hypothetical protein
MMGKDRTFESVDKSVTFVMDELSASEHSDASIITLSRVMSRSPQSPFYDLLARVDGKFRRLYGSTGRLETCHVVRPASCVPDIFADAYLRCRPVAHLSPIETWAPVKLARGGTEALGIFSRRRRYLFCRASCCFAGLDSGNRAAGESLAAHRAGPKRYVTMR